MPDYTLHLQTTPTNYALHQHHRAPLDAVLPTAMRVENNDNAVARTVRTHLRMELGHGHHVANLELIGPGVKQENSKSSSPHHHRTGPSELRVAAKKTETDGRTSQGRHKGGERHLRVGG